MSLDHLPVLIILLPLFGAIASPFMGTGRRSWFLTLAVTWSVFAGCLTLLETVWSNGQVTYAMAGHAAPLGIEYRIDLLNALFLVVVSGVAAVVTLQGRRTAAREVSKHRLRFFSSVYLLCLMGLLGIVITGDAFNVYVLLEVSSLATYTLVAMGRDRRARRAAFNYLILGSLGATAILLGIGYLYLLTGTLDMADMAARLAELPVSPTMRVAFVFVLLGTCLKGAIFPFHAWLPDAYDHAPSAVSALLSGTATKVGLYMAFRFIYDIIGTDVFFGELPGREILLTLSCVAVLYGSIRALRQTSLRRLLAWSSVAQVGYISLGLALGNLAGLTGALLHVIGHAVTKGGLFLAVGALEYKRGRCEILELRGLSQRMPFTSAAIAIGGLGLIGMPLTAGFLSKYYLIVGAFETELWPAAVVMVIGALLAAAYVWKVLSQIYASAPETQAGTGRDEAPFTIVLAAWLLIGASLVCGMAGSVTVALAQRAAEGLL